MIWEIEKDERKSFLVGTAHFFPQSFRKSLTSLIQHASTVLFEGPLDESNLDVVRQHGLEGGKNTLLLEALDHNVTDAINRELADRPGDTGDSFMSSIDFLKSRNRGMLQNEIEGLRPWMAFFKLWSQFLMKRGWKYSVDLEALAVARELGKEIVFLETIEEQLEALDGIPFERIVDYLNNFRSWERFSQHHRKQYLKGSLDGLLNITIEFPTRCPSIIGHRDPVFFERMKPYVDAGEAAVFVGTTHVRGLTKMLEEDGFNVSQSRP